MNVVLLFMILIIFTNELVVFMARCLINTGFNHLTKLMNIFHYYLFYRKCTAINYGIFGKFFDSVMSSASQSNDSHMLLTNFLTRVHSINTLLISVLCDENSSLIFALRTNAKVFSLNEINIDFNSFSGMPIL